MNRVDHVELQRIQNMAYELAIRHIMSPENAFLKAAEFVKYSNEMVQKIHDEVNES